MAGFSGSTLGAAKGAAEEIAQEVVDVAQTTGVVNKGKWNAATNVPPLSDETGQAGWAYDVVNAGDFQGEYYLVGDVIKHNGTNWYRVPTGIESNGPIPVKYMKHTDSAFPTVRASGMPIIIGDWVGVDSSAQLEFTIDGITFNSYADIVEWTGIHWQKRVIGSATTGSTAVNSSVNESLSETAVYQSEINAENKQAILVREETANKIHSLADLPSGNLDKYLSAHGSKIEFDKKVSIERKFAGLELNQDRTVQELIDKIKDVVRTYTNVTFDCNDNTIQNIVLSCFASGVILSAIPMVVTSEEYKLATLKAVYDYVNAVVLGDIKRKGSKATFAEIEALTDMQINDMWECQENHHSYLYTESGWVDKGTGFDMSGVVLKQDVVDNFSTNDSQKPASAARVKILKELVDTKQDKFDLDNKGEELATLNPTLTFINRKLNFFMDMTLMNIEASPQLPIVNWSSERKEIIKLPTPPQNYSYPSKTRIQISRPSGYWTCEENRHEFYDNNGDHYVNPTIGYDRAFSCRTVSEVGTENSKTYDKDGNEIHIAQWLSNNQGQLVVNEDGSPAVAMETVVVSQNPTQEMPNPKVYALKYMNGQGYHFIGSYFDENGNETTGNFYELIEIPIQFNTEYMYKCYLMNYQKRICGQNFVVDSQGRLCEYKIVESEASKIVQAKPDQTIFSDFQGFNGTITITPISHNASLDETTGTIEAHTAPDPEDPSQTIIDYYSIFIHGANAYSDLTLQKAY